MELDAPAALAFKTAVLSGDAHAVRRLFEESEELLDVIDAPWFSFGGHALGEAAARADRKMVDALLDLGADIDARSNWPNGPYTALHRLVDGATPERLELAEHLVSRGATVDLHAAAGMGRLEGIRALLDRDPASVNDPGPDGATALHLARDRAVAQLLIERGADVDRRCIDHRSTPMMWAAGTRMDVVEALLEHGATPDLYIAALLDDVTMARTILEQDPTAIEVRVRFGQSHAHLGFGDKYVWTLDGAQTPIELARRRGSQNVYALLLERSSPAVRMVQASLRGDLVELERILDAHPALLEEDEPALNRAMRGDAESARLLLARGAAPDVRDDESGATPLHHAAWRNLLDLASVLLDHGADAYVRDRSHDATPLGWANEAGNREMMGLLIQRAPPDIVDAAWLGDAERVATLLRASPGLVDGLDNGRVSPLRSAAWCGHADVVATLLAAGARIGVAHPQHGRTALDLATERGHTRIIELLLEAQ